LTKNGVFLRSMDKLSITSACPRWINIPNENNLGNIEPVVWFYPFKECGMFSFKGACIGKIATFFGAFGILASGATAATVNVDVGEEHQIIRGFGGMVHNQWQGGAGLSEADAELAFGTGDGHIGLNTLRIPVYASSSDFNKEVNAAKYAKKYAGDEFILYATPWTSEFAGGNQHIAAGNYQKYVDHLNEFSAYMKNQGVPLYAISISNEPDWCKEWACWTADEIYNFTKGYADQLRKNGTKVISTESFAYAKNMYDKVLNDDAALKNWDILGAHFYAMTAKSANSFFEYALADRKGVERWMTEHYTESQGSGNDWRVMRKTGDQATQNQLDTVRAMDVGYEIHRGLVNGNFSQYTWWYIKRTYGLIMTNTSSDITVTADEMNKISKRGYVLSQYARFVRPGAVRVGATANPEANLFASAYKSADGDSTIVVLVNRDYKNAKEVTVNIKGADVKTVHMYITSESKNAKYEGELDVVNGAVTVKMESGSSNKDCIVTLVGVGEQIIIPREPYNETKTAWSIPGKIEAEDFDVPGSGKGNKTYYDTDSGNNACAESNVSLASDCKDNYREDTNVDIKTSGTGHVIGWGATGEWLEYTVNVAKAGTYTMFAAASSGSGGNYKLSLVNADGTITDLTDTIQVSAAADATDFNSFAKNAVNVKFDKAGEQIIRFTITTGYVDVDYINFAEGADATDPESIGSAGETEGSGSAQNPEGTSNIGTGIVVGGEGSTVETPVIGTTPSIDDGDPQGIAGIRYELSTEAESFQVYSLTGMFLGKIVAVPSDKQELQSRTRGLTQSNGVYFLKSANGKMHRISVK